jgi:hypothetical protein
MLSDEMNVFTSLLRLVIVSHLSPKGSGRFSRLLVANTVYLVPVSG